MDDRTFDVMLEDLVGLHAIQFVGETWVDGKPGTGALEIVIQASPKIFSRGCLNFSAQAPRNRDEDEDESQRRRAGQRAACQEQREADARRRAAIFRMLRAAVRREIGRAADLSVERVRQICRAYGYQLHRRSEYTSEEPFMARLRHAGGYCPCPVHLITCRGQPPVRSKMTL